jgi:UDP-3-O-[3-hydroxymyristoyl] glucosamine N-acyltransferase
MSLSGGAAVTLGELCALLSAELRGDPRVRIVRVAELGEAGPDALAPFTDPARLEEARRYAARALLVRRHCPELPQPQLVCEDPRRALGLLLTRLAPPAPALPRGVDRRAVVEEGAEVAPSAWVGPLCYVGPDARVGAGTQVLPFS